MSYNWYDLIGNTGVVLLISSYLLLQLGKLESSNVWYSVANAVGAALIIVSLVIDFNLSAFMIEVFWLAISFVGIIRAINNRKKQ